ncbi:TVP38/TMEM64 family protein [Pleurocapsa sp. PCC 7319]|uniref:TVP38/TMEM64 family protein n=1 Tax=Pleurocapsa sp. PCC 7319 TaxID=118161 RepID=UPI000348D2CB|nr:TVP38/TMEM64 family protein [Pleurocapsa sp. PCC 7319]
MSELNLILSATSNIILGLSHYNLQAALHRILQGIQDLGWIGIIAFILLYIIATVALIPGSILTLGAGVVFGVVWGSIYVLVGAIIGETCAFLLGRYIARDWISRKIAGNKVFDALNQALNRDGLKIILLTRLSPIFPFSLLNYAFGVTGISLRDYFLGSIGMIPMTVTYVYFGSLAEDLANIDKATNLANPELQWLIKIVSFLATLAATVYITRISRKALEESLQKTAT